MFHRTPCRAAVVAAAALATAPVASAQKGEGKPPAAKNVIFFVGDGMGVSTVTATRVFSVGVDGKLVLDQFPFVALSRTYASDHITADSAPTMTAMITGVNTNNDVLGLDATTEPRDFNHDGDGKALPTLLELAKKAGKHVGVVSTARVTHATPAACYAHINNRDAENEIALQALPTDASFNAELVRGLDLIAGGGRRFFVPNTVVDEEGEMGARPDGRDLRAEFQTAGYTYSFDRQHWLGLSAPSLPVLALFDSSHMEYEFDRALDVAGEPSLTEMTTKSIELLSSNPNGFVLMVEGGRIDHAHHAGNAWRALTDAEELDEAIGAAIAAVNLEETLIVVTADHSHVFNIAGYPIRPKTDLSYAVTSSPAGWLTAHHEGLFNVTYDLNVTTGAVSKSTDSNGVPYTVLVYGNGPGYRGGSRVDPALDPFKGWNGVTPTGPQDPAYFQEAAVPMASETHSGEEVGLYAIGAGSRDLRGTVKNTFSFELMKAALGL